VFDSGVVNCNVFSDLVLQNCQQFW